MKDLANILESKFGRNVPILLNEIMALFPDITEDGVYRRIRKAIAEGTLVKRERGVYYIPTRTRLGLSIISEEEVLAKRYIKSGEVVYGYVTGLALENKAGVSQQVPGTLEIVTNNETMRSRKLGRKGGWREVILRKPRVPVTKENVVVLEALDLITITPLDSLESYELHNLKKKLESVPRKILVEYLEYYPAKTAKKLIESERYGVFA